MSASSRRRAHLVERAVDVARAAIESDTLLARTPRPPLAPVEAIPAAVEMVVPPAAPRSQHAGVAVRDEPAPVTCAQLRRAGLVSEAGPARE